MKAPQLTAHLASTDLERRQIYRLRHRVYVAEMGKQYPVAEPGQRLLTDSLDESATLIYLTDVHGAIVGTVRCNYAHDLAASDALLARLNIDRLETRMLPHVTVCARLALAPRYRRRGALWPLVRAIYRWGLEHEIYLNVIHTAVRLVPLFEHLGFRTCGRTFWDEHAGSEQQALYLLLRDALHLRDVDSPFLAELETFGPGDASLVAGVAIPFLTSSSIDREVDGSNNRTGEG